MVSGQRDNGIVLRKIDSGRRGVFSHSSACRSSDSFRRKQETLNRLMDPYAKPKERKVGARRPRIRHLPNATEPRTWRERQVEKQAVAAERRAIKKSARRHLKQQLLAELDDAD